MSSFQPEFFSRRPLSASVSGPEFGGTRAARSSGSAARVRPSSPRPASRACEKGLVEPQAVDALIEHYERNVGPRKVA